MNKLLTLSILALLTILNSSCFMSTTHYIKIDHDINLNIKNVPVIHVVHKVDGNSSTGGNSAIAKHIIDKFNDEETQDK